MNNLDDPNENDPQHQHEKQLTEEEAAKKAEEENTGMDMGTDYEEDKEQDLDDLVHSQGTLKKNEIPPPEEA